MSAQPSYRPPRFRVSVHPAGPALLLLLWGALALAARRLLRLPARDAALAAGALAAGHVASEVAHQLGHAAVAERVGYPMGGLRLWGVYAASFYPEDEPELPAGIHIRRALGGPAVSAVIGLVLAALARRTRRPLARRVLWALCFENLVVLTLQLFVPLGFNDGATLWTWARRRGA